MQSIFAAIDYAVSMKWIAAGVKDTLVSMGVDMSTTIGKVANLFIYDVLKIFFMIFILIFINSIIQTFFPVHKTLEYIYGHTGLKACFLGAVLGMVTHNPTHENKHYFYGLLHTGITFGAASSIAIASTMMDLIAFVIIWSAFGFKIAIIYTFLAIIMAAFGGFLIDTIGHNDHINTPLQDPQEFMPMMCYTKQGRINFAIHNIKHTFKVTWFLIVIFSFLGAIVHYAIPSEIYQPILGMANPFAFIISTAIGLPIYAEIFCTISLAEAMFAAGSGLGTALAFKLGTTAFSIPELRKLKADMTLEFFRVYVCVILAIITLMGIFMNYYYVLTIL